MTDCSHCQVRSFVFDPLFVSGGSQTIFDQKYIHPLISVRAFPGAALYWKDPVHRIVLEHVKDAHEACETETAAFEYDMRYHLSKALFTVFKAYEQELLEKRDIVVHSGRTQAVLSYIHAHYDEAISLSDLADAANICEREVQRCFHKDLNVSPVTYIQRYRINMACKMLIETNQSVTEIGLSCGFSNSSHFCRIFRQRTGSSPQVFRTHNR